MHSIFQILLCFCLATAVSANELASPESDPVVPPPPQSVAGVLLEKGTRKPISDSIFYVRPATETQFVQAVTTDAGGGFALELPPGKYQAIFAVMGYTRTEIDFEVTANAPALLEFRLMPLATNPYQIVVKQPRNTTTVSSQTISSQETAVMPGAGRDVLAAVSNLPGANTLSAFNGYGNGLIIRGSENDDSLFPVNEHSLPMFYHFGGFESIIEPELVESLTFEAGGFSAEYGNATGGVVAMRLKDPRTDRLGGYANLGLLSTSAMVEGPITAKDSFALSIKRGFLDVYVKTALEIKDESAVDPGFTTYPMYYDATGIYKHVIRKGNELKLIAVGSSDRVALLDKENKASERYANDQFFDQEFLNLMGEWHLQQGAFKSVLSPLLAYRLLQWHEGPRAFHKQREFQLGLSEKLEFRLTENQRIKTGGRLSAYYTAMDSNFFIQPKEGEITQAYADKELVFDDDIRALYPSFYLMDELHLDRFHLTPGVHALWDIHNGHTAIDPRLSAKYRLFEPLTLKAAVGQYSMLPKADECHAPWGTKGLKPERALHTVAGVEYRLTKDVLLDVQGYHKQFDDLVARSADDPTRFSNSGTGRAYGMECLLRHDLAENLFGWISYSYTVSKRKDAPGEAERYFDDDITHTVKTVMNYKPSTYWSFGFKYEYASGKAYTDLLNTPTWYEVDQDKYHPLYTGPINDNRLSDHHQLDFRIDRYWYFDNLILSTYLDVRNVFQNKVAVDMAYNKDYTQREEQLALSSHIPMIFVGAKLDF